jgi:transcription antitermination factor NusG
MFKTDNTGSLRWFAIMVRERYQFQVDAHLRTKQIETYLPVKTVIRHWSDRKKKLNVPLFSGYNFIKIEPSLSMRMSVLQIPAVMGFVTMNNEAARIEDHEIETVRRVAMNATCSSCDLLTVGQRVRVRGGYLDNIEGILLQNRDCKQLVISVTPLHRSLIVPIDEFRVDPA